VAHRPHAEDDGLAADHLTQVDAGRASHPCVQVVEGAAREIYPRTRRAGRPRWGPEGWRGPPPGAGFSRKGIRKRTIHPVARMPLLLPREKRRRWILGQDLPSDHWKTQILRVVHVGVVGSWAGTYSPLDASRCACRLGRRRPPRGLPHRLLHDPPPAGQRSRNPVAPGASRPWRPFRSPHRPKPFPGGAPGPRGRPRGHAHFDRAPVRRLRGRLVQDNGWRSRPSGGGAASSPSRAPSPTPQVAPVLTSGLTWPVEGGHVLSAFGAPRGGRSHAGVDIGGKAGSPSSPRWRASSCSRERCAATATP
jgi:hypothetical protein